MTNETNINMLWASLLVEELVRNDVSLFVVSPGSRSTPLALAIAENRRATAVVHFDERGAAFFAQGYAKSTGKPCALVCTSGTAAANYLPGIVEAYMSCVPLVVLTADRPPELRETGANQTIRQPGLYGSYVRWEADMACPDPAIPPEFVLTTVDQAVSQATRSPMGPVHINCAFREPLAPVSAGQEFGSYLKLLARWQHSEQPFTLYTQTQAVPSENGLAFVREKVEKAQRGIIVAGRLRNPAESAAVLQLAETLSWPVFPDIASGLRLGPANWSVIAHYEHLLRAGFFLKRGMPDTVIQLGHPFTSKWLLQQIETHSPDTYVLVAPDTRRYDPVHRLTCRIESNIESFCAAMSKGKEKRRESEWTASLNAASREAERAIGERLGESDSLTEPLVARLISQHIQPGTGLFLANSMPIRDMNAFASAGGAPVTLLVNRGASGIDGNIATAAGFASGLGAPVTAMLGDLAALHDLNSLALLGRSAVPVTLVVINNHGGGIFSFLPIAEYREHFETFFRTPHGFGFRDAATMFGLAYSNPRTPAEFVRDYEETLRGGNSAIIEVSVDQVENVDVHRQLSDAVCAALAAM